MDDGAQEMIDDILSFWFGELEGPTDFDASKSSLWWAGQEQTDAEIKARFGALVDDALRGALDRWAETPRGALALVILLDQFTRTLGRGTARAYAGDEAAVRLCLRSIERGVDRELRLVERAFLYMPLMHAEDRELADRSVVVYEALSKEIKERAAPGCPDSYRAAVQHAEIVRRFGRFPHRNVLLGRTPTEDEEAFLAGGGPTFGQTTKPG